MSRKASLALERAGFVTGFKVKPRTINSKGEVANLSSVLLTIETPNDATLVALLAKIGLDGSAVNFGVEPTQATIEFPGPEE